MSFEKAFANLPSDEARRNAYLGVFPHLVLQLLKLNEEGKITHSQLTLVLKKSADEFIACSEIGKPGGIEKDSHWIWELLEKNVVP